MQNSRFPDFPNILKIKHLMFLYAIKLLWELIKKNYFFMIKVLNFDKTNSQKISAP